MPDSRNVAHDKTVQQEKKNRGEAAVPDAAETPQPGKKPALKHHAKDDKEPGATETGGAANGG